jgi:hypothetical protein
MSAREDGQAHLPLLGITGYKRSGKDTVALVLQQHYGYARVALADRLKREVATMIVNRTFPDYNIGVADLLRYMEEHKGDAPAPQSGWVRPLLQGWGQMRRALMGEGYWLHALDLAPGMVVPDIRMPNEEQALHAAGGLLWRVTRPGCVSDGNATEVHVPSLAADLELHNDGTLNDLDEQVHAAMAHLGVPRRTSPSAPFSPTY